MAFTLYKIVNNNFYPTVNQNLLKLKGSILFLKNILTMMILFLVHLRIIINWMILFKFVLITVDPLDCLIQMLRLKTLLKEL